MDDSAVAAYENFSPPLFLLRLHHRYDIRCLEFDGSRHKLALSFGRGGEDLLSSGIGWIYFIVIGKLYLLSVFFGLAALSTLTCIYSLTRGEHRALTFLPPPS